MVHKNHINRHTNEIGYGIGNQLKLRKCVSYDADIIFSFLLNEKMRRI